MNRLSFSLKRAHQAALRFARHALDGTGLTPARYDLLHAVKLRKGRMSQRDLERVLGVTRATVSRMLASLEELEFVRREVDPTDRRCNIVWLTAEGAACLEATYRKVVRPGWVRFAFDWVLGTRKPGDIFPPRFCFQEMWELDQRLWPIRRGFADTGSLSYPR
jgi:DNA-binding MarR family transcriptional regulator